MMFEWDPVKDRINRAKHGISFEDACNAFLDPKRLIYRDVAHSTHEERFFCYGRLGHKVCTVRFTVRDNAIRIFGAGFWREGAKIYETHQKKDND